MTFGFISLFHIQNTCDYYGITVSLERKIYIPSVYIWSLKIKFYKNDYIICARTRTYTKARMDLILHDNLHKYPN